jgi:hypothetical protein
MKLRHVGTLVLALSVCVCAPASAFAGNGNGKENGNSIDAPGQVKKAEAAAPPVQVAPPADATAAAQQPAAQGEQTGVKPSNDTAHDTHAAAASDKTKEYGNGNTAGQIAMQNGAAPSTALHGPGNSQPHKVSPCAGGHEVDVHALKAKRSGSCGSSQPAPQPTPHPSPVPDPGSTPKASTPPGPSSPNPAPPSTTPGITVIAEGVTATPSRSHVYKGRTDADLPASSGAVAGVTTLPFTGLDLWSAAVVGVMLILIGLALCRRAATIPAYKSEQEARP